MAKSLPLQLAALLVGSLSLAGCQGSKPSDLQQLQQRQEQLQLQIQQLEQRLNATTSRDGSDRQGKPPAGPVKSITFRSGTGDDRLRIYWADGSTSDLPCTKEQTTTVCG
jgi:outer membrane murein-binding lipoprotein Lpp